MRGIAEWRRPVGWLGVLLGAWMTAATPSSQVGGPAVHPDLQPAADALRQGRMPGRLPSEPSPITVEKRVVPGPKDAPDVPITIINVRPGQRGPRPAVLHMHGGGYTMGAAAQYVPSLQATAAALDCVIVSVDYRLAPATTFPGSLEDNYAALSWLHRHAADIGVDARRIAVMGESAGGGHAAMLAIAARDRGQIPLVYQALVYPMLDDRTGTTRPVPPHLGTLLWTPEANTKGWTALLGVPAGSPTVPPGAVPARTTDLRGLPPAFIGAGDIDLLVEENITYAQRLIAAAVPVELVVVSGAFHGFDIIAPDAAVSKQFQATLVQALRHAFDRSSRRP